MKKFLAIMLVFSLNACKTTQNTKDNKQQKLDFKEVTIENGCLKGGECSFTVMPNKSISLQTEETTGMLYPKFETDSTMNVVKFKFEKDTDKKMMDAQYREEVIFEVPKTKSVLDLKDEDLANVHFTYGRFCFCARGSVGYFKVKKGKLTIENGKISFEFENGQVPQKLGKVEGRYQ